MAILNHPATGAKNMQPDPAVVEAAVLFSSFLFFLAEGRADGGVECQRARRFCTIHVQSEKGVSASRQHDSHIIIFSCFFGHSRPYIKIDVLLELLVPLTIRSCSGFRSSRGRPARLTFSRLHFRNLSEKRLFNLQQWRSRFGNEAHSR